jgi:glycosyltransferase involved in cell wall biosynthesis
MWRNKKVSVILPTYKEKKSIKASIESFFSSGFVDEIIVVDNNSENGTKEEVLKTKAKFIKENRQGYGHAIRRGINYTNADLIIVAEPDGSFDGKDVVKLLAYSDDFEVVFGSRTHVPLVHKGSDMTFYKRIGDVLLGKLVTFLFLCSPLTDLGCTLRITTKKAWKKIEMEAQAVDGIFATEWVLAAAKNRIKFMEIPINYKSRVGTSLFVSNQFTKGTIWGIRKFIYIWKFWFAWQTNRLENKNIKV